MRGASQPADISAELPLVQVEPQCVHNCSSSGDLQSLARIFLGRLGDA